MKMDKLLNKCWQHTIFCKKLNKKRGKKLCWFILKNLTHEMFKSYFIFFNMKYIQFLQHLNHIEFKTKSNLVTYKLIDPPRGMPIQTLTCWPPRGICSLELKQYEVAHNILHCLYHFNLFFILVHFLNLLRLWPFLLLIESNCIIFPFITNLHDLYLNLHFFLCIN
jgi:hypothetical protein